MAGKHFVSILIDEVALEGLDGITLTSLWLRLEDRKDFGLKPVVEKVQVLLWDILISSECLEFFLLSLPRKPIVIYDRLNCIDSTGSHIEPPNLGNIYPHHPINDERNGVMGSCADYSTRVNISFQAKSSSLLAAISQWGEQLVIVADQRTRKAVLCGVDISPLVELNINNYCLLERVGRGRYNGEVTQGKFGLQLISSDSKMLFYYRKCLLKLNLITVQGFYLKIKNQNCIGKIIHLKRFSVIIKSKHTADAEKIIDFLKSKPEKFMPYREIFKLDLKVDVKKILQKNSKVLRSEMVPYRVVHPGADPSQWKIRTSGREKVIRILRLLENDINESLDDDEQDEEDEKAGLLDESKREVARPLLRQGYMAVERSHILGMSQVSLVTELGINSLQARSICKLLKKHKLCGTMLSDVGRQRVTLFYCKKFESLKHSMSSVIADEKSKLLQIVNSESTGNLPYSIKRRERPAIISAPPKKIPKLEEREEQTSTASTNQKEMVILKRPTKEEMDAIKTEIEVSQSVCSKDKSFPSLMDTSDDGSSNLTLRILKRATLILQAVNSLKVIQDPQKLQRMINEEEDLEGFSYNIDRKTVLRIIDKLKADGHVKVIKVTLRGHGREKTLTFVCHPSINPENSDIQSAIEQAKMKLPIITRNLMKANSIPGIISERLVHDHRIGRMQYGYKPKFIRLRTMHFYMYYLIYDFTGKRNLDQKVKREILRNQTLDPSLAQEMSTVYHTSLDWRMFISPLPLHDDYPRGWCLVSDLLLRLPLFMFVNLVNITYKIPGIQEYLDHPIRKYYLVKDLPSDIANRLTMMRKYIFTVSEVISQLAYIGLIQYGPQILKEKDQVFIYLNKNAMLIDTTTSEEGYNHISKDKVYEERTYEFKSSQNLETYWGDLWRFAMNTKLGCRSSVAGQSVVVESLYTKKQMMETLTAKTPAEADVLDTGYLPGDRLGAGGLDSDLFVHLKRNWYWTTSHPKGPSKSTSVSRNTPEDAHISEVKSTRDSSEPLKRSRKKSVQICKTKLSKVLVPSSQIGSNSLVSSSSQEPVVFGRNKPKIDTPESSGGNIGKVSFLKSIGKSRLKTHRKTTRLIIPRPKASRKPYYDQKDKEALRRMKKLRVDWTPAEDNVLLICKVASIFMCPYSIRKTMNNFAVVREVLNNHLPEVALNKTSRACQRRIAYMMRSQSSTLSVEICLEELRQDEELCAEFGFETVTKMQQLYKQDNDHAVFKEKYDILFTKFVNLLLMRLKSVVIKSNLDAPYIPDSLEEFYSKYNVVIPVSNKLSRREKYNEVQNNVDIMCSVVNSVIHSSLAGTTDKTCYSYQLLHIYQQYPDKLLRSVMAKCRNLAIVSIKKITKAQRKYPIRCLPLATSPFQLSQNYAYILQTKYQYQIFYNSYCGFTNLIYKSGESIPLELDVQNGGECANVVELYSSGLINLKLYFPEQVIILDPKLAATEETYEKIIKRFRDLISHIKASNKSKKVGKNKKGNETDIEDEEMPKEDCDYEEFNLSNKNGLASAASRLGLFMLRDDMSNSLDSNLQHAHDYFVLNPSKVTINFPKYHTVLNELYEDDSIKQNLLSTIKKLCILPEKKSENSVKIADKLSMEVLHFIEDKRELGASCKDIRLKFGDKVVSVLDILINEQLVIRSGVVSVRFIHYKFSKHWVIRSYRLTRQVRDSLATGAERDDDLAETSKKNESGPPPKKKLKSFKNVSQVSMRKFYQVKESNQLKEIEVVIRPWLRVDGTLNRRVLDRMLGSVLGHILTSPGISLQKIQDRFVPALQPVHTIELALMLSKIGCVQMVVLSKSIVTLLSRRSTVTISKATGLEEPSSIFVEPDPLAITKFGLFIGNKVYSEDYLENMIPSSSK